MNPAIEEVLTGYDGSYIFPFLWLHGEPEADLREIMRAIRNSGIGAVCVESRPHPDFCGDGWWRDMDIILDEAKQLGMQIWIDDMAHIAMSGNMRVDTEAPAHAKQYLARSTQDITGPFPEAEIRVREEMQAAAMPPGPPGMPGMSAVVFTDDQFVCMLAQEITADGTLAGPCLDLTGQLQDGVLFWDVPAGRWRISTLYLTRNGGGDARIPNLPDADSVKIILDKVYEPHYAHYGAEFGKTIVGFFADEPMFGNTGGYQFQESIGRFEQNLPWCAEVPAALEEKLGPAWQTRLLPLWQSTDRPEEDALVRYVYMDTITRLTEKNFTRQIGSWCSAHGVAYGGHVIEDCNQHTRLGCGLGHFFRAMSGQSMAGIDDIGNQVFPGGEDAMRRSPGDGTFYHYVLGRLGSSAAHLCPEKHGDSLCEIFGAYGWGEGVGMMQYLTDHFLVRGINHFVPHAFTAKKNDPEFPPHFYENGNNPQYRHFGALMRRTARLCRLFSGGKHAAPVALLYHAEAEWTAEFDSDDAAARLLTEHQIGFDILPADVFAEPARYQADFSDGLQVNGQRFRALVIPKSGLLTRAAAAFCRGAGDFPVIFLDALPHGLCEAPAQDPGLQGMRCIPTAELPACLEALDIPDIRIAPAFKKLACYHYDKQGDLYMFNNESMAETWQGTVLLPRTDAAAFYDAFENVLRPAVLSQTAAGTRLQLTLAPGQSAVLVTGCTAEAAPAPGPAAAELQLTGPWDVARCAARDYPAFSAPVRMEQLQNMARLYPDFSGFFRYETAFQLPAVPAAASLTLEHAGEGAEVWVNGRYAGMRICAPYCLDLTGLLQAGTNSLRIEIATTLDRAARAGGGGRNIMGTLPLAPTGLWGQVTLRLQGAES